MNLSLSTPSWIPLTEKVMLAQKNVDNHYCHHKFSDEQRHGLENIWYLLWENTFPPYSLQMSSFVFNITSSAYNHNCDDCFYTPNCFSEKAITWSKSQTMDSSSSNWPCFQSPSPFWAVWGGNHLAKVLDFVFIDTEHTPLDRKVIDNIYIW